MKDLIKKVINEYVQNLNEVGTYFSKMSSDEKRKAYNDFVSKALTAHGNPDWEYDFNSFSGKTLPIEAHCNTHNVNWTIPIPNQHIGKKVYICPSEKNLEKKSSFEEFVDKINEVPKYREREKDLSKDGKTFTMDNWVFKKEDFKSMREPMNGYCEIHDKKFLITPIEFTRLSDKKIASGGCKECSNHYRNITLGSKTREQLINEAKKYCSTTHFYQQSEQADRRYEYKRFMRLDKKIRNEIYDPKNWSEEKQNWCAAELKSRESIGEKKVKEILEDLKIKYIKQQPIKDVGGYKNLFFDFYLPEYNLYIEYDGEQHYKLIEFFNGKNEFMVVKKRDGVKNMYVISNNFSLLRITYEVIKNKDIKNIIEGVLIDLKNKGRIGVVYKPKIPSGYVPIGV